METTVKLITDNEKVFNVGMDIHFSIGSNSYIGEITKITESTITIKDIVVNGTSMSSEMIVVIADINENSCDYVHIN